MASVAVLEAAPGQHLPLQAAQQSIPERIIRREWLDKSAEVLSHAALGAVSVLDLPLVVIDGSIPAALHDGLVAATEACLTRMRHHGVALPRVQAGALGRRARALGAAALPLSAGFLPGDAFSPSRQVRKKTRKALARFFGAQGEWAR